MRKTNCPAPAQVRDGSRKPLTGRSDAELIVLVRARALGWKLAFNVLLGRHRPWIVQHCARRLGNHQDAQDVAQQVALRAWQAIDRFEGRSAFRTWLYSIAENQCRSYAVRRGRYVQTEHIERLIDLYMEGAGTGLAEHCAREQAVSRAMENVSEGAREVLVLRFFHEYSLEEISAALAISLSAAKMRLYRSLDQFRAAYLQAVGTTAAAL